MNWEPLLVIAFIWAWCYGVPLLMAWHVERQWNKRKH